MIQSREEVVEDYLYRLSILLQSMTSSKSQKQESNKNSQRINIKMPIDNASMYSFLLQWDHVIPSIEPDNKHTSLVFQLSNWKATLKILSIICIDVFGVPFSPSVWETIDLIHLHDEFLDYISNNAFGKELKMNQFLELTNKYNETHNIWTILKSEFQ